jgi:hypothetical protein
MTRKCSTFLHVKRAEIDRRLAAGEPGNQIASDYGLNPSSLHRQRRNCLGLASSNAIMKEVARGTAAAVCLPTKEDLNSAYFDLRAQIDEVVAQAKASGSFSAFPGAAGSARSTGICMNAQPASTSPWSLTDLRFSRHNNRSHKDTIHFNPFGRGPSNDVQSRRVNSWGGFSPLIIAHDVGRSRDSSTAVVGGNSPYGHCLLGIADAEELPQGLFGSARASALAAVDRRYNHYGLIVADLSNDPSYADVFLETFGPRVIGMQIKGGPWRAFIP